MFLIVGDVKSEPRNNTAGLRVNIHKQVQLIGQQIRMRIFLQKTRSSGRFVNVALPDHFRPYFKKLSSVPLPPSAWSASPSPAPPHRTWDGERGRTRRRAIEILAGAALSRATDTCSHACVRGGACLGGSGFHYSSL